MRKTVAVVLFLLLGLSILAAQPQTPPPPPDRPQAQELTPQVLGEMLRTATTFHELITRLDPGRALGPDQHVLGSDGRYHHSVQRTAAVIGAGAGTGAAIGGMTRRPNGILIGAIIGSAGGLIIDQIIRSREESRMRAAYDPGPEPPPEPPRELQHR